MAQSKIQQLQKALKNGDTETATKLANEIAIKEKKIPLPKKQKKISTSSVEIETATEIHTITTKRPARRESMAGLSHTNTFDSWMKSQGKNVDNLNSKLKKIDREVISKSPTLPKPGNSGSRRSVAKKIAVRCDGCSSEFNIYPSEMMMLDEETTYKCDRCIKRGK